MTKQYRLPPGSGDKAYRTHRRIVIAGTVGLIVLSGYLYHSQWHMAQRYGGAFGEDASAGLLSPLLLVSPMALILLLVWAWLGPRVRRDATAYVVEVGPDEIAVAEAMYGRDDARAVDDGGAEWRSVGREDIAELRHYGGLGVFVFAKTGGRPLFIREQVGGFRDVLARLRDFGEVREMPGGANGGALMAFLRIWYVIALQFLHILHEYLPTTVIYVVGGTVVVGGGYQLVTSLRGPRILYGWRFAMVAVMRVAAVAYAAYLMYGAPT